MKNFIVPIDFSNESLNGLKMAILFSRKRTIDIQMIYVLAKSNESSRPKMENEHEYAEENFHMILKEYTPLLGNDSSLSFVIKSGRIYQQVVEQAQLKPNTVITASTHGASGFQEFFIGSNAYRIVSATECPVITLRKNKCPREIRKIVMPIDLSTDTRQKVPFTTDLAALCGSEIHVLGVYTSKSTYYKKRMKLYLSQVSGYVQAKVNNIIHEVHGDHASDLVVNYSEAVDADMISITTDPAPGISLIIGNAAHQILNKAECPVLCQTPKALRKAGTFASMGG